MPVKRTGNTLTFQGFTISVRDCVPFIRVPEIRDSKNTNIQKNETVLSIFAYMAIAFIQFHTNHCALSAHASSRCFVHRNAETVYSTFSHFL